MGVLRHVWPHKVQVEGRQLREQQRQLRERGQHVKLNLGPCSDGGSDGGWWVMVVGG